MADRNTASTAWLDVLFHHEEHKEREGKEFEEPSNRVIGCAILVIHFRFLNKDAN